MLFVCCQGCAAVSMFVVFYLATGTKVDLYCCFSMLYFFLEIVPTSGTVPTTFVLYFFYSGLVCLAFV